MVIIHPEYAILIMEIYKLKDDIASLIVERDMLRNFVCKDIEIDYMLKIGALEYKLTILQNNYSKNLRKLKLIQEKISKKQKVNLDTIDRKIKSEFKTQNKAEEEMSSDIDFAIEVSALELFDYDLIEEMNIDYFKVQKLYNPIFDLNFDEEKEKMYHKIEKYYLKRNLKKLHKLAENYDENEFFQDEISNLKLLKEKFINEKINLSREIRRIKNTFPYNQKTILEDENLCRRKKDSLNMDIADVNAKNKKIETKISTILKKL